MKKLLLVLFIISQPISAQNDEAYVDQLVNEFTAKLEERGIPNWYSNKRFCTGSIEMFQMENGKMCTSKGTYFEVYVLWEEEGTTMIKKIDNCGLFYSIPLKNNELMEFVDTNYPDMQLNHVKPYKADNITGNPVSRTTVQPCKRSYVFKKNGGEMKQNYSLYDLTTSEEHPNTNYEHNNDRKIVALDAKLDDVIDALAAKFKRQKN
ncbi:MAG: hypothetical protein KJO05_10760 [Bacteroidia bacterium]|nr:hypothetical protein [Bacteroidia bacterium]NNF31362.1 hypothetical protein [Flavobacteriaceae bacterium]MBT8276562.1 hypothetical protein [Bacteroidia bacterium]NNJ82856.1 hypothetical protein [Flavobacteriaceae bacterium]NNK54364.1 hypothetical protein [Flavobacteriaceae bacterium]